MPWCLWPLVGCERRGEGGAETRRPRRKRSPPSREAERTSAGFGEAIYCWTPTKGWPYCGIRSLSIYYGFFCTHTVLCNILLYSCGRVMLLVILNLWHVCVDMLYCWDISDISKRLVSYDTFTTLMHVRFILGLILSPAGCLNLQARKFGLGAL